MKKKIKYNDIEFDYYIYSDGRVYSNLTNKFLQPGNENGYLSVTLFKNGQSYQIYVHRLVCTMFIPNPENKPQVNHIDGIKTNNDVSNLEWVTCSENIIHAFSHNLKKGVRGELSHFCKTDSEKVHLACKLMEEGLLTLKEISKITEISFGMIWLICQKESWVDVSKDYNVSNYYRDRASYSHDQYEKVFKLLEENQKSLYDISDLTNVRYSSIGNILAFKPNPIYDDLFMKYDISKYIKNGKEYKDIPNELIEDILKLKKRGISNKYIKRVLSKKYLINEEKIRVYMRDHI